MTSFGVKVKLRKYFSGFITSFPALRYIHSASSPHALLAFSTEIWNMHSSKNNSINVCLCMKGIVCLYNLLICHEQTMCFLQNCHTPHSRCNTDHVAVRLNMQQLNVQAVWWVNPRKLIWQLHWKNILHWVFLMHTVTVQHSWVCCTKSFLTRYTRDSESTEGIITFLININDWVIIPLVLWSLAFQFIPSDEKDERATSKWTEFYLLTFLTSPLQRLQSLVLKPKKQMTQQYYYCSVLYFAWWCITFLQVISVGSLV